MNRTRILFVVGIFLFFSLGFDYSMYPPMVNAQANPSQMLPLQSADMLLQSVNIPFNHVIIDSNGPDAPWTKSVGDINGDGLVDLIVGGYESGGLVWYKNPSWSKQAIASGGFSARGNAEVVDIDGDGDNDIVTATSEPALRWYENPGNPETGSWISHLIESRKFDTIGIADFDGDGDVDLVARNQTEWSGDGNILHFYWQESPTSWSHQSVICPHGEGLIVMDVNRDGKMDVVVNQKWYENKANRSWTEHVYTTTWTHPNAFLARGDINGDGWEDIVVSPSEREGNTYRISWFEAPAAPTSQWMEHIVDDNVETVHHFVGVADMDNDGDMDVAAAEMHQGSDPDEVKVYINEGNGQSWTKQVIATTGSHAMRIVDVDDDGDMDLYGANWQGREIELWENLTCPPTLDNWERHVVDSEKPWRSIFITSADMDGDGKQDIITGGWWYQNPGSPDSIWTRNTIGSPLNNMAAVYDFDGDGDVDVLGTKGQDSESNPNFVWARNDGSGAFTILDNIEGGDGDFLQGVAVGRFQDGGNLEVALSWHIAGKGIQKLTVPSAPSSRTWIWDQIFPASQDEALSTGDIDRDGDGDLLLGTKWLRNDGTSWTEYTLHGTSGDPDRNRLADINRDGRLDAVIGFEAISTLGKLAWYEQGSSATSIWTEHVIANVIGPMSLDVADMDGDGDLDVIVGEHNISDPSSAKLYVFENDDGQGGSWTEHIIYTGDEHHDGAQVVDIDGDGDLDIISIGWDHNRVLLYENKAAHCGGGTPPVEKPTINPNGGTFSGPVSVMLSTTTPGASIHYTLGGSEPTVASMSYTEPFTLTSSAIVKARGFRSGYNPSNVASASFTIGRVPRVTNGQQVLYTFKEGSGTTVYDVSGTGTPLNLSVENGNAVIWLPGHGLAINSATIVASAGAATKIIDAKDTGEITIEAWVKPANTTQDGPARIVTLSEDPYKRNFTLEQGLWGSQPSDVYDVRLRTTSTDDDGTMLATPAGSVSTQLSHVVYTRDALGVARIYVNNVEWASGNMGGDFSNWDEGFRLALANELTEDRPWLGEFHLVAIYNRALSQAEVSQNFNAGLTTTTPLLWLHLIPQKWR